MGFAFAGLAGLIHPLRLLLAAAGRRAAVQPCTPPTPRRGRSLHATGGGGQAARARPTSCQQAGKPLRVLRIIDAGHAPAGAGRMLISGRMADVCAELERLAALEAAAA